MLAKEVSGYVSDPERTVLLWNCAAETAGGWGAATNISQAQVEALHLPLSSQISIRSEMALSLALSVDL